MCYPNKVDIVYTPILTQEYLYMLRPSGHSAWRAACEVGVAFHRSTHRGCRGGARKQRPIHVIVSTQPTVVLSDTNCVNYDSITCVSVTPSPSMDHSEPVVDVDIVVSPVSPAINKSASSRVAVPVKLGIVNARSIFATKPMFLRIT